MFKSEKPELKNQFVIDPLATSFQIRMVYTDSLKINSILTAPKHEDYKNLFFKYSVFPDGLKLVFYDSFGCPSTVEADYGTIYKDTSILRFSWEMLKFYPARGIILKLVNYIGMPNQIGFLLIKNFKFWNSDYDVNAKRLDANKQFTKFNTGRLTGTMSVEEK